MYDEQACSTMVRFLRSPMGQRCLPLGIGRPDEHRICHVGIGPR
ncbi:hypothetical protein [Streptomyces marianii]|nr:hypothetical protein [Streptomyces marianii]